MNSVTRKLCFDVPGVTFLELKILTDSLSHSPYIVHTQQLICNLYKMYMHCKKFTKMDASTNWLTVI